MKASEKVSAIISKLEIFVAVMMFFVMLITCGLYINIKLNGKTSGLPQLSETDAKMLLLSSTGDDLVFSDDLLEPVFIGIKKNNKLSAVLPSDELRSNFAEIFSEGMGYLISGDVKDIEFENEEKRREYIDALKNGNEYILFEFYDDLPSTVIVPCVFDNFKADSSIGFFLLKYVFLTSDKSGSLYASAISRDGKVVEIYPDASIRFDKLLNESYDISEGLTEFDYTDNGLLNPVFLSSFKISDYCIESISTLVGKDSTQEWVLDLFDVFSLNQSLVRSFSSGDKSQINYVDEYGELTINDSGDIEYNAFENGGVNLDMYSDLTSVNGYSTSFSDIFFGLKTVINSLSEINDNVSYSLVGIDLEGGTDSFKVYFKYMTDGIFLYATPYDAVFEIKDEMLVSASFKAIKCVPLTDSYTVLIPEKYALSAENSASDSSHLVLLGGNENGALSVGWASRKFISEVSR